MTVDFGGLLRDLRLQAGWTQEELAEESGISTHAISVLETGRRRPRVSSVSRLADALKLDGATRDRLLTASRGRQPEEGAVAGASAGDPSSAAAAQPAPGGPPGRVVPRLLPYAVPDFTGRSVEVAGLLELVAGRSRQPAAPVVISAIDGMAGVGKTALAVHVGHLLAEGFPDGQLFVDLHGFTPGDSPLDAGAALARLLRAVGVGDDRLPEQVEDRAQLWRSEVADRRLLIVLDNAADAAQVRPLIPGSPGSLVLITSRRRLPALAGAVGMSLDVLGPDEAVALFTEIVGPARVAGHGEAVVEIVTLCGRLPLAVRIAAARLAHRATWTPEHLLVRLRDQHRLLAELSVQDHSVAAAFAVSYETLTAGQRRLFTLAGLHPGEDFAAPAAAALADVSPAEAEDLLDDLYDHHLVVEHAPGRYTFHDLLRRHAIRTADTEEPAAGRRAALGRLLEHYRRSAVRATTLLYPHETPFDRLPELPGSRGLEFNDVAQAESWLSVERLNLVAAALGADRAGLPGETSDLSSVLHRYLDVHACFGDALALHTAALHATEAQLDRAGQVQALITLGAVQWRLGHYPVVIEHFERALALARAIGDRASESRVMGNLGLTYLQLGRYQETIEQSTLALESARELGDRVGQGHILGYLGLAHDRLGHYAESVEHHRQALAVAREIGDRMVEARTLCNLGVIHIRMERDEEGGEYLRQALVLVREVRDRVVEAIILGNLGAYLERSGRYPEAIDHHEQSIAIFQEVGDPAGEARSTTLLGVVRTRLGQYGQATELHRRALAMARELGDQIVELDSTNMLGENAAAGGDPAAAVLLHEQALTLAAELADRYEQARAHAGLGEAHDALGQRDLALAHWRQAYDVYRELGLPRADAIRQRLAALGEGGTDEEAPTR
ncbi:ATP-binding protein [Kitasatospora nipponensis]|uniref:ATP-binding protein n=1 Tax=Kitasatospora nipponensis TaxID=258049 RepID=UPI0031DEA2A7